MPGTYGSIGEICAGHMRAHRVYRVKLNITNIVNGTPDIILDKIDTHSLNGFTNYVKLFLLQTYQDACIVPKCYICSLSNTLNT